MTTIAASSGYLSVATVHKETGPSSEGERQLVAGFEFYTRVVALARASSSELRPLPLNKAYKAKLKFILKSPS